MAAGRWARASVALAVSTALGAGCSDDASSSGSPPSAAEAGGAVYAVLDGPGWELREAVDPGGEGFATEDTLDWFAEYDGPARAEGGATVIEAVRLSGHAVALDAYDDELAGYDLQPAEVADRPALVSSAGDPAAIVAMDVEGRYTLVVLSHDMAVDRLREVAGSVRVVAEAEWVAAGGEVLDCSPLEPGCVDAES